jgi:hypothetical protein
LEALSGWEQKSWSEKREAIPVIDKVFEFGGIQYAAYVDANHSIIREYLQSQKRNELIRRESARGTTDER